MGMTFPQWRTQVRLHLALRLLAEGLSATAAGHRCGWSTTSAFVDVFRRALGHTPGRSPTTLDPAG
jgi:AraC-like DNA-binding protein